MTACIDIRLDGYWISSSGRGLSLAHDAETVQDHEGFPYLPGRHLKGLLREAVRQLVRWKAATATQEEVLFGATGLRGGLVLTDARPPEALRTALGEAGAPRLFDTLAMTAIAPETGVAATGSLRVLRVALPMTLEAELAWESPDAPPAGWIGLIRDALPLIRAVGAQRHRGLGRALLTLRERAP